MPPEFSKSKQYDRCQGTVCQMGILLVDMLSPEVPAFKHPCHALRMANLSLRNGFFLPVENERKEVNQSNRSFGESLFFSEKGLKEFDDFYYLFSHLMGEAKGHREKNTQPTAMKSVSRACLRKR